MPTEPQAGERRAQGVAGRAEIERAIEAAQHRAEPLGEIRGDAIEQERFRARAPRRGGGARAADRRSKIDGRLGRLQAWHAQSSLSRAAA